MKNGVAKRRHPACVIESMAAAAASAARASWRIIENGGFENCRHQRRKGRWRIHQRQSNGGGRSVAA
jgi:hypothetical protein